MQNQGRFFGQNLKVHEVPLRSSYDLQFFHLSSFQKHPDSLIVRTTAEGLVLCSHSDRKDHLVFSEAFPGRKLWPKIPGMMFSKLVFSIPSFRVFPPGVTFILLEPEFLSLDPLTEEAKKLPILALFRLHSRERNLQENLFRNCQTIMEDWMECLVPRVKFPKF